MELWAEEDIRQIKLHAQNRLNAIRVLDEKMKYLEELEDKVDDLSKEADKLYNELYETEDEIKEAIATLKDDL